MTNQSRINQVKTTSQTIIKTQPNYQEDTKKRRTSLPNMIERCKSHQELKTECNTPKATGQQPYGHQPECPIKQQQLKSSKRRNPSPTGNREGVPRDPKNWNSGDAEPLKDLWARGSTPSHKKLPPEGLLCYGKPTITTRIPVFRSRQGMDQCRKERERRTG